MVPTTLRTPTPSVQWLAVPSPAPTMKARWAQAGPVRPGLGVVGQERLAGEGPSGCGWEVISLDKWSRSWVHLEGEGQGGQIREGRGKEVWCLAIA